MKGVCTLCYTFMRQEGHLTPKSAVTEEGNKTDGLLVAQSGMMKRWPDFGNVAHVTWSSIIRYENHNCSEKVLFLW